jgi:hypothetical protein
MPPGDGGHLGEVVVQDGGEVFGFHLVGQVGEAHEVREEDGQFAALMPLDEIRRGGQDRFRHLLGHIAAQQGVGDC